MRKLNLAVLITVSLLLFGGISSANGQLRQGSSLKAYIPYDFTVQDKRFPAGQYSFSRVGVGNSASTLLMRGANGDKIFLQTIKHTSLDGYPDTELVFDRVDGRHFLSTIRLEGEFTGYEIPASRMQRQLVARARRVGRVVISSDTAF